jgi:hypothetical protein
MFVLKKLSRQIGKYCFIDFASVKTVFVEPHGSVYTKFYRPTVEIRKDLVIANHDGAAVGKVNLK